jgi:polysaccharide deacetylase 2 family uncharacterized protein YibQ
MKPVLLVIAACLIAATSHADLPPPQIAIIIDDLGNARSAGERAIALPGQLTYSILPNTPGSVALATAAHNSGREVLLHLPLQAMNDAATGHDVIHLDMTMDQLSSVFDSARLSVPFAVGVNNHRGSLITRHPGHMRWLMDNIRNKTEWFFVDSYTTHHSVAMQIAEEAGVPAVKRDVFLDASRAPEDILLAIEKLKSTARKAGRAVAIGHPYPETLDALERALPDLEREGFQLVPISLLMRR